MIDLEKIKQVQYKAYTSDVTFNLSEGFNPKTIHSNNSELVFWYTITNLYGLLVDCSPVQFKGDDSFFYIVSKKRYGIISNTQYKDLRMFYEDISSLRKWFAHNQNPGLYFSRAASDHIKGFLGRVIGGDVSDLTLSCLDEQKWNALNNYIENSYNNYVNTLIEIFERIKKSTYRSEIITKWQNSYANSLLNNDELVNGVIMNYIEYLHLSNGTVMTERKNILVKNARDVLKRKGFDKDLIYKHIIRRRTVITKPEQVLKNCIEELGLSLSDII